MEILPPADSPAVPDSLLNKPVFHRVVHPSQLVGLEGIKIKRYSATI
jgi:hypothetical protein